MTRPPGALSLAAWGLILAVVALISLAVLGLTAEGRPDGLESGRSLAGVSGQAVGARMLDGAAAPAPVLWGISQLAPAINSASQVTVGGVVAGPNSPSRPTDVMNTRVSVSSASNPQVSAATMTVVPNPAVPNQMVTITGASFTTAAVSGGTGPAGVHQITGTGTSLVTVGGIPVGATSVTYPIDLDTSGNLLVTFVLPADSTILAATSMEVKVTDQQGVTATTSVGLVGRQLTLQPDTSGRSSIVKATGKGFPANNPLGTGNFPIRIEFAGASVVIVNPTASGTFEANFTVPLTAGIPSTNRVTATSTGYAATASTNHSVPAAILTIDPTQAPAGSTISLVGQHFPGFSYVSSLTIGILPALPIPAPSTDGDGNFSASILVPDLNVGAWSLTATVGGIRGFTSLNITQPVATPTPTPAPPTDPATALEPLGDNLVRLWGFDPSRQNDPPLYGWSLFDPRPRAADLNTVTEMVNRRFYFMLVNEDQTVTLNGKVRELFDGWNPLPW